MSSKNCLNEVDPHQGPIQEFENFNKMEIKLCKSLSGNEKKVCKTLNKDFYEFIKRVEIDIVKATTPFIVNEDFYEFIKRVEPRLDYIVDSWEYQTTPIIGYMDTAYKSGRDTHYWGQREHR